MWEAISAAIPPATLSAEQRTGEDGHCHLLAGQDKPRQVPNSLLAKTSSKVNVLKIETFLDFANGQALRVKQAAAFASSMTLSKFFNLSGSQL